MKNRFEITWEKYLKAELESDYFKTLVDTIDSKRQQTTIYPEAAAVFNAFTLCPFTQVKVVILGQDPYHGAGQAHGLAFSVPEEVKIPPSLTNIYKEIVADIGTKTPHSGNLERWAKQGVLLLNSTLTVEDGKPGAHQKLGWERFTDAVIKKISDEKEHVVFLLWGNFARSKQTLIDPRKHLILEAPHPSPLSAYTGFFGCKHFSKTNAYLKQHQRGHIDW
jgi:uracil-DNA glycosylase